MYSIESINSDPDKKSVEKIKIYGQTLFGAECKLLFNIKYVPNNKFGMRDTEWIKVPTTLKKDDSYEAIVDKEYYSKKDFTGTLETFVPEFQCPGYSQGGRAILYLSDKTTLTKRVINCTRENLENKKKTITCAVANTHSIGFEKISSLSKQIELNFVDMGMNIPYYKLIK